MSKPMHRFLLPLKLVIKLSVMLCSVSVIIRVYQRSAYTIGKRRCLARIENLCNLLIALAVITVLVLNFGMVLKYLDKCNKGDHNTSE
jgi:hypothetical protein